MNWIIGKRVTLPQLADMRECADYSRREVVVLEFFEATFDLFTFKLVAPPGVEMPPRHTVHHLLGFLYE